MPLIPLFTAAEGGPASYTLVADTGSFTLTGNAANLLVARILQANAGSFTFTGQPAGLSVNRRLVANTGFYVFTGREANFSVGQYYSPDGTIDARTLPVFSSDPDSYVANLIDKRTIAIPTTDSKTL